MQTNTMFDTAAPACQKRSLQRLRQSPAIRHLVQETRIAPAQLVMPFFVSESETKRGRWEAFTNFAIGDLLTPLQGVVDAGVQSILLFGVPDHKTEQGIGAIENNHFLGDAIATIKARHPKLLVMSDVCLCSYATHGHCGVLDETGRFDIALTLERLAQMAVEHARAGVDLVAPSAMQDGMVSAIRSALDDQNLTETGIMSYSTKFASCFYEPFRDTAKSAPAFGDRRTYQLEPGNRQQAIRESVLDDQQGADMLMVKPAGPYLDIIRDIKNAIPNRPLAAYQVSGEYAMIRAAAEAGVLNEARAIEESLLAIRRAGADVIITYFAAQFANAIGNVS